MNNNKNRLTIVLAAIIITLVILGCGQLIWQHLAINKPLENELKRIDGITSFYINGSKINDKKILNVTFQNVNNLQKTYHAINKAASNILGEHQFNIVVHDNRDTELEAIYYEIHLFIQEGIATGKFSEMAEHIKQTAMIYGVSSKVYVDNENVYLSLQKSDKGMYIVIPRSSSPPEVK